MLCSGFIETEMTGELNAAATEEWKKSIPLKRGGQAEEVADACVFLGSDMSRHITGQVLQVDGMLT
jgi:3-oxoacyl-[acyl-carrier protein] reductase